MILKIAELTRFSKAKSDSDVCTYKNRYSWYKK